MSHLIAIDPDTPTTPEEPGYEFGYAIFVEFPKVQTKTYEVNEVIVGTNKEIIKNDPELQNSLQCIENRSTYPAYSFFRCSEQPMMTLVTMDFQEHMQPSNEFSSGKE